MSTPEQPAPQNRPPHYAAPQYAAPPAPPGAPQPQYGVPQQYPPQQYPVGRLAPPTNDKLNVFGLIALIILVLNALQGLFTPMIYQQMATSGSFALTSGVLNAVNIITLFVAAGLAIIGVTQKQATRLRWAAVGSLVAAGIALLASFASLIGGLALSAIPYY